MLCLSKALDIDASYAAITERMILKGKLNLITPLIVGGGGDLNNDSDIIVLRDKDGTPFIPSTSITGSLKHRFEDYDYIGQPGDYEQNAIWFWGGDYMLEQTGGKCVRRSCQSSMSISDLKVKRGLTPKITVRDGIEINRSNGLAKSGAKYDYEIVEPGISLDFAMEVVVRKASNSKLFDAFLNWSAWQLSKGDFSLGAKTRQGFGRCQLEDIKMYRFIYSDRQHLICWLTQDMDNMPQVNLDFSKIQTDFQRKHRQFRIEAGFRIRNSLIIGSYPGDPQSPDKVQLKSYDGENEIAVTSGPSFKGVVKAQAERILNTLGGNSNECLKNLFGWVEKGPVENGSPSSAASRLNISEKPITINTYIEEIQSRIKIDRFTGKVVEGALFDSMPVWSKDGDSSMVLLELCIDDYKDWEAGLMISVLKDLWNSDLAIGGEKSIGRGTLQGQSALISMGGYEIKMEQKGDALALYMVGSEPEWDQNIADKLEACREALNKRISSGIWAEEVWADDAR